MKNENWLTTKQRDIQRIQIENDKLRLRWQKVNGLGEDLTGLTLMFAQAQMIATNILKHGGKFLAHNQAVTLNNFLSALRSSGKRQKLKDSDAHKVMNIGKEVNRKMFKAHRHIK